jgi:membrane protein
LLSIALLLVSATGVFGQLQRALNRAWEVEPDPRAGGWRRFVSKRLLSFGMIIVIAFLLLVSLVLTTFIGEIVRAVQGQTPTALATGFGVAANTLLSLSVATLLFAAVYKVLPDARMRWRDLWGGAFITAVLFVIGKSVVGWYLSHVDVGASWGTAAASLIAVLVWVYYTSLLVLFGAELTQVWVSRFGGGLRPARGAAHYVEEKRHVR